MGDDWADNVRVHFKDGPSILLSVRKSEDIQAVIAEECEREGWDTEDVVRFEVEVLDDK